MILALHILFGAALANQIHAFPLNLIFAFLSHYLLDFLPHKDLYSVPNIRKKQWKKSFFDFAKVFLDLFFGFLLVLVLALLSKGCLWKLWLAGFSAALPDGLNLLSLIFPKNKILARHSGFHKNKVHFLENKKIPLLFRTLTQLIIFWLAVYLL